MADLAVLEGFGADPELLGTWAIFRPSKYKKVFKKAGKVASKVGASTIGKTITAVAKPLVTSTAAGKAAWDLLTPAKRTAKKAVTVVETAAADIKAKTGISPVYLAIGGGVIVALFLFARKR